MTGTGYPISWITETEREKDNLYFSGVLVRERYWIIVSAVYERTGYELFTGRIISVRG